MGKEIDNIPQDGMAHIVSSVLSTLFVGWTIYYLNAMYGLLEYKTVVTVYSLLFSLCCIIYICQFHIGIQILKKYNHSKIFICEGYICFVGGLLQAGILTSYSTISIAFQFSEHRPFPPIMLVPIILYISVFLTVKCGLYAIDRQHISSVLLLLFLTYLTFTTTITFASLDPDLSNLFAATLKLKEEYVMVDDITIRGGETNYLIYSIYMLSGLIAYYLSRRLQRKRTH